MFSKFEDMVQKKFQVYAGTLLLVINIIRTACLLAISTVTSIQLLFIGTVPSKVNGFESRTFLIYSSTSSFSEIHNYLSDYFSNELVQE